jgi:hypothetical protein
MDQGSEISLVEIYTSNKLTLDNQNAIDTLPPRDARTSNHRTLRQPKKMQKYQLLLILEILKISQTNYLPTINPTSVTNHAEWTYNQNGLI